MAVPVSRRPLAAALMGIGFVVAYVAVAISLPAVLPKNWVFQALYFLVAGVVWVFPIRWLMLWSVGKR